MRGSQEERFRRRDLLRKKFSERLEKAFVLCIKIRGVTIVMPVWQIYSYRKQFWEEMSIKACNNFPEMIL